MSQHQDYCGGYHRSASNNPYQLQTMPGVEERLLQLEGDKDSLNLQVGIYWHFSLICHSLHSGKSLEPA